MIALLGLLAADRQSVIILAFWTLVGAGVVVSVGAWILLRRESSHTRPPKADTAEEPAAADMPTPSSTPGSASA
jgi:hypothetical protein